MPKKFKHFSPAGFDDCRNASILYQSLIKKRIKRYKNKKIFYGRRGDKKSALSFHKSRLKALRPAARILYSVLSSKCVFETNTQSVKRSIRDS